MVTFNRLELLKNVLKSLMQQTVPPTNIVVVNNNSNDGTVGYLSELSTSNNKIKVVNVTENIGGAGGFALGVEEALKTDCDWISLSDDDAIFDNEYFASINNKVSKYPDAVGFSGTSIDKNGNIQNELRAHVKSNIQFQFMQVLSDKEYKKDTKYNLATFVGIVYKRSLIERIGLPDSNFFIHYDDIEYSLRLKPNDYFVNIPDAIIHHQSVSYANPSLEQQIKTYWRLYYDIRNEFVVTKKYTKHPILSWFYCFFKLMKKEVGLIIHPIRYSGYKLYLFNMYRDAYFDFKHNRLGRNDKYLPGLKK